MAGNTDLQTLSENVLALVKEIEDSPYENDEAPEYVQSLWNEIQTLNNILHYGRSLDLNFAILGTSEMVELAEVIQAASNIVNELRLLVKTINLDADPAAAIARFSASDCNEYSESLIKCHEKMTMSLNFLQIETLVRLVTCVQDAETIRYFNDMNAAFGDDVALAFPSQQGKRSGRKSGGPCVDTGNAITEASFGGRQRFAGAGASVRITRSSIPRGRCPQNCGCACHKLSLFPIPLNFRRALKRLFPRLVDDPVLVRRCTTLNCKGLRARQRSLVCVMHSAFINKAVVLSSISRGMKLRLQVKSYPVVPGTSDIIQFAMQDNVEGMRELFRAKKATSRDTSQNDGWSALHSAVYHKRYRAAKFLLEQDADYDIGEIKLRKPMHFAKFRALTKGASDVEKRIADLFPDKADFKYDFDLSPILIALLGEYDPEDKERPSLESLITFAKEAVDAPLNHDWRAQKREYRNRSPLFLELIGNFHNAGPTRGARLGVLADLLNGPDGLQSWAPLQWAAYVDRESEFVALVDNEVSFPGQTPSLLGLTPSHRNVFHHAAESGTQDVLEYLFRTRAHERGVNINGQDRWGETPLHIAAARSAASVALLLDHGADANILQEDDQIPLHNTRLLHGQEQVDCINHFLRRDNPPINSVDVDGKPPLFHLLKSPECVTILLNNGADTSILDRSKKSVLHHVCAEDRWEVLEILLRNIQAQAFGKDNRGDTPLLTSFRHKSIRCLRFLLEHKSAAQAQDKKGWTLLHHAVQLGNDEILKLTLTLPNTFLYARTHDKGENAEDISRRMGTWDRSIGEILKKAMETSSERYEEPHHERMNSFQLLSMVKY